MSISWAFNSATVMHLPWQEELCLLEEFGWSAAEVWLDKWHSAVEAGVASSYSELARQCRSAGVEPIGACVGVLWTSTANKQWEDESAALQRVLEFTSEIGASNMALVVVGKPAGDLTSEYAYVTEKLSKAAILAATYGVRLNLEFLGGLPFNGCLGSGIELVRSVDHPNLGLLFDLVHYYVSSSHLEELAALPHGKLFGLHIDDSPRRPMESLGNEDRCFPGEGRIPIAPIIRQIQSITGYSGPFTVELYSPEIWKLEPRQVFTRLRTTLQSLEAELVSHS